MRIAKVFAAASIYVYLTSCGHQKPTQPDMSTSPKPASFTFDTQGHRGCRGYYPENTVPSFLYALDIGVRTLELDVVIAADSLVICSHEPWFSPDITTLPDGTYIDPTNERNFAIFHMSLAQIAKFDVGLKPHPLFPNQRKLAVSKPTLAEVIAASDAHAIKTNRPLPYYNIEIKTEPDGDGLLHPEPKPYCDFVIAVIDQAGIENRFNLQSFDLRILTYIRSIRPDIVLALLVENEDSLEENVKNLGFTPEIYSPHYTLVTEHTVSQCKSLGMKIIPWTINETEDMKAALEKDVDGIITDYPDRLLTLIRN